MARAAERKKKYRVVQWGTGSVGKHALRAIVERPDMELVGVRVYNPNKVDKDAGDILGIAPLGVTCVNTLEDILKLDADCVNYNPRGVTLPDPYECLKDICALLEAGFNVVGSAPEMLIYPPALPPDVRKRVDDACKKGNSTVFVSGINPGFMCDLFPIFLSRICRRVDRIYCAEIVNMLHMTSIDNIEAIGFGLPPDVPSGVDKSLGALGYSCVIQLIADAMNIDIERIEIRTEKAVTPKPIKLVPKTIDAGTVCARKIQFIGWSRGREMIEIDCTWRVCQDVKPEWPNGDKYIVRIDGDPSLQTELFAQTEYDSKRPISLHVAMAAVNAIPTICNEAPGLKNVLELPMWGARTVVSDF